ncbi:GTP-binding protein [Nitrosomonas sp. PY1]|uniref:GTPase family protein n=1 Tax=Nitrosomonas sp. PY1 TaxID=1803906 RepID=UPI001FC8DBBB|nr:GTPase [Nitrosomonas sp. PY1]GKS68483.1 GTP-binding protein [Nitrosomonas sp. PY1]
MKYFSLLNPLRVLVFLLLILPILALLGFGVIWLWQSDYLVTWLIVLTVCGVLSYGLQSWLVQRESKLLQDATTIPNPIWPPSADTVWKQVETLAENTHPKDWPLENGAWTLQLAQQALQTVAHNYHPDVEKPLLELTIPHTLLIIERASRDLRRDVAEKIPFSHRLTLGDLFRIQRWKTKAEQLFNIYRAGNIIVNPVNALLSETWRHLRERSFMLAKDELHRWFLRTYVRKVGYYAIDLYSGRLSLGIEQPDAITPVSEIDLTQATDTLTKLRDEPLRILVLGRSNSGKSSLINALFGDSITATDTLPDTTDLLKPFVLTREGLSQAIILDSPGCDSSLFNQEQMLKAAGEVDLILWITPADRPDRQIERDSLDALRAFQTARTHRHASPLLVVVSFIDRLRPINEWQPPYDLNDTGDTKSLNINRAIQAVANDLAVPIEHVIPVSLSTDKVYNVDDALWSAILNTQNEALRMRLMRCLDARKNAENWNMLRHQMISTGRFLKELPDLLIAQHKK